MPIDVLTVDDRIKQACLALLDSIEREDEYLRLQQMREFKKHNLFWHGFQYLFWSDIDQDWRIPTHMQFEEISANEDTKYIYDYVVNHFKAHGEAVIAALSADIPDVRFGPRDAEDPSDRRAVEMADNTAELIEKWNRAKLQIINALFYLATEGFVASYTYNRKDEEYGTVNIPQYSTQAQQMPGQYNCPNCGYIEPEESSPPLEATASEDQLQGFGNIPTDMAQGGIGGKICPQCGQSMDHQPGEMEEVPFMSGETPVPKGREIVEIYGPLNVRMPSNISKQADAGYLVHYIDADPALFKGTFPKLADQIESDPGQNYERIMRQTSLSMDGYQLNIRLATQKRVWLRKWMLFRLDGAFDDIIPAMQEMFGTGIYFSCIGQTILEMRNESMDPHWTITKAGPSKGIHADPLLKSLVPLQELKNNLTNLLVMQVEYGVPSTYADPEVFDFQGQQKQEVAPGYIYPAIPRPGQSLDQAFFTDKMTTLNKETPELLELVTNDEQFVVGSYPSVFGGPQQSGSKTLGEYDRSRAFALQRLGLVYYFLNVWWGETIHKAVTSFVAHQLEDEPLTVQTPGGFQTKWIRQAEFKGSFDRLEPEASSDFPVSFSQKRQTLMALFQLGNPQIESVLFSPENAGYVQKYVGLNELKLPSESQRRKQTREILQLIGLEPLDAGQGQVLSSVPIEPDIDDHNVHIQVLTEFLVDDAGQDLKQYNPQGYANCLAHLIEHKKALIPPMPVMPPGVHPPVPHLSMGGVPPKPPQRVNGAAVQ